MNYDKFLKEMDNKKIYYPATIQDGQYKNVTQVSSKPIGAKKGQSVFPKRQKIAHRIGHTFNYETGTAQDTNIVNSHYEITKVRTIHAMGTIEQDAIPRQFGRVKPYLCNKSNKNWYKAMQRANRIIKSGHDKAKRGPQGTADLDNGDTYE